MKMFNQNQLAMKECCGKQLKRILIITVLQQNEALICKFPEIYPKDFISITINSWFYSVEIKIKVTCLTSFLPTTFKCVDQLITD